MTNWDTIQFDFEVSGLSLDDIAAKHDVSIPVLQSAIENGKWSAPTTSTPQNDFSAIQEEAEKLNLLHQKNILSDFTSAEKSLIQKVKDLIITCEMAEEAKKLAETLELLRPQIIQKNDNDGFNGSITLLNAFPVPQPGDKNYVAANAVIIGKEAGKGTALLHHEMRGTDDIEIQTIEVPEYDVVGTDYEEEED